MQRLPKHGNDSVFALFHTPRLCNTTGAGSGHPAPTPRCLSGHHVQQSQNDGEWKGTATTQNVTEFFVELYTGNQLERSRGTGTYRCRVRAKSDIGIEP